MEPEGTSLNDLPGGPAMTVAGQPDRQPDPGNQAAVHDIMQEMEARRSAESNNSNLAPQQLPPMQQTMELGGDPYAGGYTQHLHTDLAQQHAMNGQAAKQGFLSLLSGALVENIKEPALVAVICFLVHQEFFSNVILSVLPTLLRQFAAPGSSSLIPSIVKAVIVGVLFMLLRRAL